MERQTFKLDDNYKLWTMQLSKLMRVTYCALISTVALFTTSALATRGLHLHRIKHSWATPMIEVSGIVFKQNLNTIRTSPSASQPQPAKPQASQPQASPQSFVSCRLQTCGQLQTLEHEAFKLDESYRLWSMSLSTSRAVTDFGASNFQT